MKNLISKKSYKVNYKILNPGGNKTAIVIGNEYSTKDKKEINDEILKENPEVEQVGFIDTKENKLEMAGGEFCINRDKMCHMAIFKRNTRKDRTECFWIQRDIKRRNNTRKRCICRYANK